MKQKSSKTKSRRLENVLDFARLVRKMVQLMWQAQPTCFTGVMLLQMTQSVIPLGSAWLTKLLFDSLARSLKGADSIGLPSGLMLLLAGLAALTIAN